MTEVEPPSWPLAPARRATSAFFLLIGIAVATWGATVPFVKARLALDAAHLGTVLLSLGAGSIAAMLVAARVVHRWGSRPTLVVSGAAFALFLPFLPLAPSPLVLAALLFGFGVAGGLVDVAGNAQAIVVQAHAGRPLMSGFHGMFSGGGLVGAAACSLLLRIGIPIEWCAVASCAALLGLVAAERGGLVPDEGAGDDAAARPRGMPPGVVLLVGTMALVLFLSEGAVLDWGAVFLHEARGYAPANAALGYAAFSVTMAGGRFLGDRVVARLGPVTVVRAGSALAALGFVVMVLAPGRASGLLGCLLIGLGASNVVPTLISASAWVSPIAVSAAVSTVVAIGTAGLIAGPAAIGWVAQATSLRAALGGLAIPLLAVAAAAAIVRPPARPVP